MDIVCDKCNSKYKISDSKIPKDKKASIPCPKCKNKIIVEPETSQPEIKKTESKETKEDVSQFINDTSSDSYEEEEASVDFEEDESHNALVCEANDEWFNKIDASLKELEFRITRAESVRDVLKKMRYHEYGMVVLNELFDTDNPDSNGVLKYIERLAMSTRREMFVTLLSSRFKTFDSLTAFNKSVNIIINTANLNNFKKILNRGISENDLFFRIFHETQKKIGVI